MDCIELMIKICAWIGVVLTVLSAYKYIFLIVGAFGYRKFAKTDKNYRYGICVAARNEECVIENFLESVAQQDYPLEQIVVFLVAHNCQDKTAEIARKFHDKGLKVVVYERNAPTERTKGYALKYLFEQIEKDYNRASFDGYFIFDADNVLARDYLTRMNESFAAGNKIVVSFRNSKNINQNWISFGYAMHWMRTCFTENRGKSVLKQSCRVQGTGFLFASEVVRDGWQYVTLTEDRSFCTDAVLQNYKICYCEEAVFYDEQPYSLKIAWRQRLRWAKGHLQSTVENCPKLLKNMFRKDKNFLITYDSFWLNFPRTIESGIRKLVKYGLEFALVLLTSAFLGWWKGALLAAVYAFAKDWLVKMLLGCVVMIVYRKRMEKENVFKRIIHVLLFPLFDIIGKWATYAALFTKVEWKAIPHDRVVDVKKL